MKIKMLRVYNNWLIAKCCHPLAYQLFHSKVKTVEQTDWNFVLNEAEKIVGYPTSFMNLRFLLSDEFANIAFHLRKLIGTSHPLLETARNIIIQNEKPTYGLIVLLVSKAGGLNKKFSELEQDTNNGVLNSQRALAEVTEMLQTSNLIHSSLINFNTTEADADNMNYGNKVALLCGDYVLSNCYHILACIRNQELNEIMSSTLRDLSESNFIGPRDKQNKPLPAKPVKVKNDYIIRSSYGTEPLHVNNVLGRAKSEWTLRTLLSGGTLLGKSCQGALKLGGHNQLMQEQGYNFGTNLALAWQAWKDRHQFLNKRQSLKQFSLVSAPVLFHLQYDPQFYDVIEKGLCSVENVDYDYMYDAIINGPGLEKTQQLQMEHSQVVLDILTNFLVKDGRNALSKIINAMQDNLEITDLNS